MSVETPQETLIGEPGGEYVDIETDGRVVRPLFALPSTLVDECKRQVHQDGMQIAAIDPANVGMIHLDIWPRAFDAFETNVDGDTKIGLKLDVLTSALSDARLGKSTKDDVALHLDESISQVEIERDYSETAVTRTDETLNIDPHAVREEPDLPDLDMDCRAAVDVDAFKDAIDHLDKSHDHVELAHQGSDLTLTGGLKTSDDPVEASRATFKDVVEPVGDELPAESGSVYPLDYLTDIAKALMRGKVDALELHWAGEFPVELHYKRTGEDGPLYEGRYMLAPRIQA